MHCKNSTRATLTIPQENAQSTRGYVWCSSRNWARLLFSVLVVAFCVTSQAQKNPGNITGEGADPSNAKIVGARVMAVEKSSRTSDLDLHSLLLPVPVTAKHAEKGYFIWDGSIVRGNDGKYHMYYSRWSVKDTFYAWVTRSEVVHAVGNSPFGPFVFHDVALPPRGGTYWDATATHNPTVKRFGKKYYLYYMGDRGNGILTDGNTNIAQHSTMRIGVAVADNPNGPWRRFDKPVIDVSTNEDAPDTLCMNNSTVIQSPTGSYMMIYKASDKEGHVANLLATADSPVGPFRKELKDLFPIRGVRFPFEDPFFWYDVHRKMYFAVLKDMKGYTVHTGKSTLVLFESKDARHWSLASQPIVSELKLTWADGRHEPVRRMERPQLLFDKKGGAIALTVAILDMQGNSWNVTIPLKKAVH